MRLKSSTDIGVRLAGLRERLQTVETFEQRFELSAFELDVVLLAALPELEPDGASLLTEAQGDARLTRPTVAFALSSLPDSHWSAFSPDGPLRRYGLIEIEGPGVTGRAIVLPERIAHHLVGVDAPEESLLLLANRVVASVALPPTAQAVADDLSSRLDGMGNRGTPAIALCGPDPHGKAMLAAVAAATHAAPAYLMKSGALPASSRDQAMLARQWSREARLSRALLIVDASEASTPADAQAICGFAESLDAHLVILCADAIPLAHRPCIRIDVPRAPAREQRDLWNAALGDVAERLNGTVDRLASHFSLGSSAIAAVGSEVQRAAAGEDDDRLAAVVWAACRRHARPKLDELALRIPGSASWDHLVLPPRQKDVLRTMAAQVRRRSTVYETWGFAVAGARGLGINALFAGPSGTGKTLAAEILGSALELDVYRIDLSAVVSKWIGETEKNLRRVFDAAEDGGVVLLFDEADALFGKRSDVKDSHDRYANIEVSYLLQRMEAYRGLAILTTNLKSHIDEAFLRRVRFVVDFPFPGGAERREIWRHAFPAATPTARLDWDRLAQLNVTGGSIRNIAINAAFRAADEGTAVGMAHVRGAARAEYDKLGKSLTDAELRGWSEVDRV